MPRNSLDFRHRANLIELMDEPCSREVLRGCLRDIARTNRWTLGYRPMFHWLREVMGSMPALKVPLRILDVGCGYGDGLRRVEQWATTHNLAVDLTGLDLNPDATAIAGEASPATSRIQWVTANILTYTPQQSPHFVVSSLFTHHLAEERIVQFLRWMEEHAQIGWLINDLSRAPIPCHLFRAFAKMARLHPFVQYDGPVSIARSFIPEEWRGMCAAAGLRDGDVEIRAFKPARLCVARRKQS